MKKGFWILIFSLFSLLLAACGSQATPEPLEVTIIMTEYAFEPADLEFQVGQKVTLNLVNEGSLAHEIMFGREVMMMDSKPNGYQTDMFEMAGIEPEVMMMESSEHMDEDEHEEGEEAHSGFMVFVPVGDDTYSLTFTVTEEMVGEWEIGCFELDGVHYTAGMVGTLSVVK